MPIKIFLFGLNLGTNVRLSIFQPDNDDEIYLITTDII